jgi:uncharacterized membrane protein
LFILSQLFDVTLSSSVLLLFILILLLLLLLLPFSTSWLDNCGGRGITERRRSGTGRPSN